MELLLEKTTNFKSEQVASEFDEIREAIEQIDNLITSNEYIDNCEKIRLGDITSNLYEELYYIVENTLEELNNKGA